MFQRILVVCLFGIGLWWPGRGAAEPLVLSHLPNDQPTAQAFRILQEAYRRIGIETREELLPHERSLRAANAGEVDGEVMRIEGIEAQFPNLVPVPEPVFFFDTVAYTTGLGFKVEGWDSLRAFTLCIARGMKLAEQGTEGMERVVGNTVDQMIEMLLRGRCQIAILGRLAWLDFDRAQARGIRQLEPPIASLALFHYVHKRHQALVPRLAETLRNMRQDGTIAAIAAVEDEPVTAARKRVEAPNR